MRTIDDVKRTRRERATTISSHNRVSAEEEEAGTFQRRGGEGVFARSKLTAALDTAIPSSQFGILRSHSNKMVRDNGAL